MTVFPTKAPVAAAWGEMVAALLQVVRYSVAALGVVAWGGTVAFSPAPAPAVAAAVAAASPVTQRVDRLPEQLLAAQRLSMPAREATTRWAVVLVHWAAAVAVMGRAQASRVAEAGLVAAPVVATPILLGDSAAVAASVGPCFRTFF